MKMSYSKHKYKECKPTKCFSKILDKIQKFYSLPKLLEPINEDNAIKHGLPVDDKTKNNVNFKQLLKKIRVFTFLPDFITPLDEEIEINSNQLLINKISITSETVVEDEILNNVKIIDDCPSEHKNLSPFSSLNEDFYLSDAESCLSENRYDDELDEAAKQLENELFRLNNTQTLNKKSMPTLLNLIDKNEKIEILEKENDNIKKPCTLKKNCKKQSFKKYILKSDLNIIEPNNEKKLDLKLLNKLVRNSKPISEKVNQIKQFNNDLFNINKQRIALKSNQIKVFGSHTNTKNLNIMPKSKIFTLKGPQKNTDLQKLLLSIRCKS